MSQPIDMNNNFIENLKTPTANDHAANKDYVDNGFLPVWQIHRNSVTRPSIETMFLASLIPNWIKPLKQIWIWVDIKLRMWVLL